MTDSNRVDATTVFLLVLVALVAIPVVLMGLSFGGMMGYGWMMGSGTATGVGGWPLVALVVPPLLLLVVLGGGYLVVRRLNEGTDGDDAPMAELRMAYARGELTDEEFETRRRTLQESE
jgi:putative membrane protein